MDKVNMMKNKNRRSFFRIYDEVNLFYQKIDEKMMTESHSILDDRSFSTDIARRAQDPAMLLPKPEENLPDLQFTENETRNVNISASGIAFNCDDALKEGDYLLIKILLLSSMTVILTYCQVVYCKNSQANSQYPYFVGAHFVNMSDESRASLLQYVSKKQVQQSWVGGIILAAVITVIVAPATVFGLLFELLHFLLELSLHLLHLAFEFIESNLDHLIEHLFHTDLHKTQVIVFYIIAPVFVYGLYRLWRVLPSFCRRCKDKLFEACAYKKASLVFFWQELTLFDKCKLVAIGIAVIVGYIFFGM
ncbi:MAG: PilZ domain-containing protein [Methylobacter sp.]|nr:MAG: PilZ domain-containing protein [Methylobacter sp.]